MVRYENECCDCATPGYPCLGDSCSNRNVPHFYCDECGMERKLYEFEDEELCIGCIENRLEPVSE